MMANSYFHDVFTWMLKTVVNRVILVPLWFLRVLIKISTAIEKFTGADCVRRRTTHKPLTSNGFKQYNYYNRNLPLNLQLSRPVHQIIADTFREEFVNCYRRRSEKTEITLEINHLHQEIANSYREIIHSLAEIMTRIEEVKKTLARGKTSDCEETNDDIRVLLLRNGSNDENKLYRIKKGFVVQFTLDSSLFGKHGHIYCNYPMGNNRFKRDEYQQLPWTNDDEANMFSALKMTTAGAYRYYFQLANNSIAASGYVVVDPELQFSSGETLPLECIQCQTVLMKSMGRFITWPRKLQVAKESGYNMIHFTPIQELGESTSSYSIRDQLQLNPSLSADDKDIVTFDDVKKLMQTMRTEWKMLSICDVVLNHTANDSPWLLQHPEATYNCANCPYMRPAYLLDAALFQFGKYVARGVFEKCGVPATISSEDHLNAMKDLLHNNVLKKLRLHELFICDVDKLVTQFTNAIRCGTPTTEIDTQSDDLQVIFDRDYKRLGGTVDLEQAIKMFNVCPKNCVDEEARIEKCAQEFKMKLNTLNKLLETQLAEDLNEAVENVIAEIRYHRVLEDGPRWTEISAEKPLTHRYFTDFETSQSYEQQETTMYGENAKFLMAFNGWVANDEPLQNFAATATVYLRRQLHVWTDSVKLRYGETPEGSPFLWERMRMYVEQTALIFDGFRLDNCHSTPLHVAEYFVDCARLIRPNLYVIAELFTKHNCADNIFVNRVGICSLVREALTEWSPREEGQLVFKYGGNPVGAFNQTQLTPIIARAMLFDQTHDNRSAIETRSVYDLLPSAALMNIGFCASGSVRGYDELVPHHIDVVREQREYTEWGCDTSNPKFVNFNTGIITARKLINKLHLNLARLGYDQVYVDQMSKNIIVVTRHHPVSHSSVILIAYTAFKDTPRESLEHLSPLQIEGVLDEIIFEAGIKEMQTHPQFVRDNKYINGLRDFQVHTKERIQLEKSQFLFAEPCKNPRISQFRLRNFLPGSIVALKVSLNQSAQNAVRYLHQIGENPKKDLRNILDRLNFVDFNRILYRCNAEEMEDGVNNACYHIPAHGDLLYAGLQGVMSLLSQVRQDNDLGHPLCRNLREGDWLLEYIHRRLQLHTSTKDVGDWIEEHSTYIKHLPRYLLPTYFDAFITNVYAQVVDAAMRKMGEFVQQGSIFIRALALGSIQFTAIVQSAPLPPLSPQLTFKGKQFGSLAAGLPHFSTGYMRNWGRDTFIALRGLLILTGRHEEARYMILAYAACLRHGLIPNLLNGGVKARYNCRDAVWWWLYCIKSYVDEVPDGEHILQDPVSRIFPTEEGICEQPLHRVMQEALEVHFQGLSFRERNAGKDIDEHMNDEGFNNRIGVDFETGFIFGGNEHNCGTWMDKMGSSAKAGNKGVPASPRDGSAIELIGLSKSVITWLIRMHQLHAYPYDKVQGSAIIWTFQDWADRIQRNFEKCFWISLKGETTGDILLVHRKGIYKDCYGATSPWTDFQLRCNFPIAMVVAPELFDAQHAWIALENTEKHLLGPLGMRTLDPADWNYRGDYDNANDGDDKTIAHGFNYHQGPEWVWPIGYYLRAKLHFGRKVGRLSESIEHVKAVIANHFVELQTSAWSGLPELTNANGAYCKDSSRTQAWSMACILEVLYDLERLKDN